MKIRDKIFKHMFLVNFISIIFILILFFSFQINQLMKFESENLFLLNTLFEKNIKDILSLTKKYMEEINSTNDIVFVFDKNSLIRDFSQKSLKKRFEDLLSKNDFISEILIIDENQKTILKSGNTLFTSQNNEDRLIYTSNNCYLILKNKIDFKEDRNLIFILNINKIYISFLSNLKYENTYKLLISYNNKSYIIQNNNANQINNYNIGDCCLKSNTFNINNMTLGILKDKYSIYKEIYNSLIIAILIFIVISFFIWLIAKIISTKITNPLLHITNSISNFNFKEFKPITIKDDFEDEIKSLSIHFNSMGKELIKYINDMEELVKDRTKKIEEQNKKLEQLNIKLKSISITDELTSLYNRRYFNEIFISDYKFAYREKLYINFAIIDIDHFKQINDKYGHLAGDYCLSEFGRILKNHFHRDNDKIFRYGGEEFVIYFLSKKLTQFETLLESLRKEIENTKFNYKDTSINFTISIGAIAKIPETEDYKNLIMLADNNLYKAKNSGRNKTIISY